MKNSFSIYLVASMALLITPSASPQTMTTGIFHEVDVQVAFFESDGIRPPGPLAVPGSSQITQNIQALGELAFIDGGIKKIASKDSHFQIEVDHAEFNGEFHGETNFPPHAMADRSGLEGDGRLPEVLQFSRSGRTLSIPHHREENGRWVLQNFDPHNHAQAILDPNTEVLIKKNGVSSYSVWMNPRTQTVYDMVNPDKSINVYVYGVATDFCVYAFANEALDRGYRVHIVTDAIAGIDHAQSQHYLKQMEGRGAYLRTTAQVLEERGYAGVSAVRSAYQNARGGGVSGARCEELL